MSGWYSGAARISCVANNKGLLFFNVFGLISVGREDGHIVALGFGLWTGFVWFPAKYFYTSKW